MAEKKPKKELGAIDTVFDYLGYAPKEEEKKNWEGNYKKEARDHGLTKAKHKMEKKSGNEKKKKDAITRVKRNMATQSKAKPKKSKNVLIQNPKPKKDYSKGGMSEDELGRHNLKAVNSLFDALEGNGPTALDIASAKKVAEDKVTGGLKEFEGSKGFDFKPPERLNEGDRQLAHSNLLEGGIGERLNEAERQQAHMSLLDGDSETLTEQAGHIAGVETTDENLDKAKDVDVEAVKERPEESWLDWEKLAVAFAGLITPAIGYALGGYEGALHGAGGTASGAIVYGKAKQAEDLARVKAAKGGAKGKTISLTMDDERGKPQDYIFKFDDSGKLEPVMNPVTGKIASGTQLAKARIEWKGKANVAAVKGAADLDKETLKGERDEKKEKARAAQWLKGLESREKLTQAQIDSSMERLQKQIDSREKIERARIAAKEKKDKEKGASLPIDKKKQVDVLSTKNASLKYVRNGLKAGLDGFRKFIAANDVNGAVKHGQGLGKILNSAEGADAVGVEEAKNLLGFLKVQIFNFTEPGPTFGRDLAAFDRQLAGKIDSISNRIVLGEREVNSLLGRSDNKVEKSTASKPASKKTVKGFPIKVKRPVGAILNIKGKKYEVIKETENGSIVKEL